MIRSSNSPAAPVLVTGFEPFEGRSQNPSGQLARALHGRSIGGRRIQGVQLPVDSTRLGPQIRGLLDALEPAAVMSLGLAWGREGISLETRAANWLHLRRPDNAGAQPRNSRIEYFGPDLRSGRAPVTSMLQAMGHWVASTESRDAGRHLCNFLYFTVLGACSIPTVFVHLPATLEMHPTPGVPAKAQADLARAVEAGLETFVGTST